MYIKPEINKNDITAMAVTMNEVCIGWLPENYFLMEKEEHFW